LVLIWVYYEAVANMGILGAKNNEISNGFADADPWVLIWVYYEAGANMGILGAKNRNMEFPMVLLTQIHGYWYGYTMRQV